MGDALGNATVGEIAAADLRAARLFDRLGIDFCCGGRQSIEDACGRIGLDPTVVRHELAALPVGVSDEDDVSRWPLDRLIDHIVARHHTYTRLALPAIRTYLTKLEAVHGQRHPELVHVRRTFDELSEDLLHHLYKEEQILFPYVRELVHHARHPASPLLNPFGTVENPIRMMEHEHQEAGDALRLLRGLTQGYETPPDGCGTYAACMAELSRFERDLHRHIHLENNVLFPAAVALEPAGAASTENLGGSNAA
jgi:regulator of cell morphogenesis and NO signaling